MHALPAMTLDIVLLRSLLEVVDTGGFALAAHNLALTPSAVSGHIKRLEHSAGKQLLARTTRSLELTAAGELLFSAVDRVETVAAGGVAAGLGAGAVGPGGTVGRSGAAGGAGPGPGV